MVSGTMSDEASLQPGITATVITASVLAVLIVILRLIVRKFVVKSIGWDDWTILCAAVRPFNESSRTY